MGEDGGPWADDLRGGVADDKENFRVKLGEKM